MLRLFSAILMTVTLTACASTPVSSAERLSGRWVCTLRLGELSGRSELTYRPDGAASGPVTFSGLSEGVEIDMAGEVTATWAILESGRLQETITRLHVISGNIDGLVLTPEMIAQAIQPMIAGSIEGRSTVSDLVFEGKTMTLTSEDGVATLCSR
jgi:hypothetical protein